MPSLNILLEQSLIPVNGFQDLKLAFAPYVKDMDIFKQTKKQKLLEFISKIYLPKLLKTKQELWGENKTFQVCKSGREGQRFEKWNKYKKIHMRKKRNDC